VEDWEGEDLGLGGWCRDTITVFIVCGNNFEIGEIIVQYIPIGQFRLYK
jgi:hypothetical protein